MNGPPAAVTPAVGRHRNIICQTRTPAAPGSPMPQHRSITLARGRNTRHGSAARASEQIFKSSSDVGMTRSIFSRSTTWHRPPR